MDITSDASNKEHSLARAPQKVAPKMMRGMAQTRMYINIYLNEINILHQLYALVIQ